MYSRNGWTNKTFNSETIVAIEVKFHMEQPLDEKNNMPTCIWYRSHDQSGFYKVQTSNIFPEQKTLGVGM